MSATFKEQSAEWKNHQAYNQLLIKHQQNPQTFINEQLDTEYPQVIGYQTETRNNNREPKTAFGGSFTHSNMTQTQLGDSDVVSTFKNTPNHNMIMTGAGSAYEETFKETKMYLQSYRKTGCVDQSIADG